MIQEERELLEKFRDSDSYLQRNLHDPPIDISVASHLHSASRRQSWKRYNE